ncbi:hypothetical protein EDD15DRAFT_2139253, partial [Pisolithus albus]
SICDVCTEEFGPQCILHSIPCGESFSSLRHLENFLYFFKKNSIQQVNVVLCSRCCHKIVEKTLPRLQPVCPFCREHFTSDDVRLIHIDFSASGYTPSWRRGGMHEAHDTIDHQPARREECFPLVEPTYPCSRTEVHRLEDKVARVAAKKCSVEEVSSLHQELQDWLSQDESPNDEVSHPASFDSLFFLSDSTACALGTGISPTRPTSAAPSMMMDHLRQPVSSSAASIYSMPSTLSRYGPSHLQSASTSIPGSRPVTPARATTPAVRHETLLQSSRLRATSPVPPLPSRPRKMSFSATSPKKIQRSYSDESDREIIHKRWMPNPNIAYSPPNSKSINY